MKQKSVVNFYIVVLYSLYMASCLAADINISPTDSNLETGKQIYLTGTLPSGSPVSATVQGDVEVPGNIVTCVGCHKRSGLGSSESGKIVLPITKQALYQRKVYGRSESVLAHYGKSSTRSVYTDESLKIAIREGIDPDGKPLDPLMPRYKLQDAELDSLVTYIKSLSVELSPGIDEDTIKFATIVTDDIDTAKSNIMLEVLQKFFTDKNAGTRNESGRAKRGPWHKESEFSGYRLWQLNIWHLKGAGSTWNKQLLDYYQNDPVFAVISGISNKGWAPVHDFCVNNEIPCLFPNTDLPKISDTDFYPAYFNKGITLQANILAAYLDQEIQNEPNNRIVQIYQNNSLSLLPANIMKSSKVLNDKYSIQSIELDTSASLLSAANRKALDKQQPANAIIWTDNPAKLNSIITNISKVTSVNNIYIPSSILGSDFSWIEKGPVNKIKIIYPYEIPKRNYLIRTMHWAKMKKIDPSESFILANTYFSAKITIDAITHIRTSLYRDYFIERIEHMLDNMLTTSVFPRVSIAPNQRFISKGGFIAEYRDNNLKAISKWITP